MVFLKDLSHSRSQTLIVFDDEQAHDVISLSNQITTYFRFQLM